MTSLKKKWKCSTRVRLIIFIQNERFSNILKYPVSRDTITKSRSIHRIKYDWYKRFEKVARICLIDTWPTYSLFYFIFFF